MHFSFNFIVFVLLRKPYQTIEIRSQNAYVTLHIWFIYSIFGKPAFPSLDMPFVYNGVQNTFWVNGKKAKKRRILGYRSYYFITKRRRKGGKGAKKEAMANRRDQGEKRKPGVAEVERLRSPSERIRNWQAIWR